MTLIVEGTTMPVIGVFDDLNVEDQLIADFLKTHKSDKLARAGKDGRAYELSQGHREVEDRAAPD